MVRTSTDRLLRRTRRRLFFTTLALLTLLVVGVGAATVVVATSSLDADLDRALEAAVLAQVAALDGEMPSGEEQQEAGEHSPAVADTVLLVLDAEGRVLLNRTGQTLPGLPDTGALKDAAGGLDIRTVETDGTEVRVLTMLSRTTASRPASSRVASTSRSMTSSRAVSCSRSSSWARWGSWRRRRSPTWSRAARWSRSARGSRPSAASWRMPRTSSAPLPPSSAPTRRCWSASGSWRTTGATCSTT